MSVAGNSGPLGIGGKDNASNEIKLISRIKMGSASQPVTVFVDQPASGWSLGLIGNASGTALSRRSGTGWEAFFDEQADSEEAAGVCGGRGALWDLNGGLGRNRSVGRHSFEGACGIGLLQEIPDQLSRVVQVFWVLLGG